MLFGPRNVPDMMVNQPTSVSAPDVEGDDTCTRCLQL